MLSLRCSSIYSPFLSYYNHFHSSLSTYIPLLQFTSLPLLLLSISTLHITAFYSSVLSQMPPLFTPQYLLFVSSSLSSLYFSLPPFSPYHPPRLLPVFAPSSMPFPSYILLSTPIMHSSLPSPAIALPRLISLVFISPSSPPTRLQSLPKAPSGDKHKIGSLTLRSNYVGKERSAGPQPPVMPST